MPSGRSRGLAALGDETNAPDGTRKLGTQGNPKRWNLDAFFEDIAERRVGPYTVWGVGQFPEDLRARDRVFFWRAGMGQRPGIIGVGQILGPTWDLPDSNYEYRLAGHQAEFEGRYPRVPVWIESVLDTRLTEDELRLEPTLAGLSILNRVRRGITQFPVTAAEAARLLELCEERGATL
jgi:EVE domain